MMGIAQVIAQPVGFQGIFARSPLLLKEGSGFHGVGWKIET